MKKNHWAIVLLSLPVLISFVYFFRFAVDSPWFDDIEAIPAFVLDFFGANTWSQKIDLLLKPNNEHRILFTKLMSLLSVGLLGKLNFVFLMLLGNLCILGIFWLFYKNFKPNNISLLYFVPLAFLLFQPHYHLLSFWSITSLQHQPTVFFVFLALYLLSKPSDWFMVLGAMVVMVFATFSMSNGMFGWAAGLVVLLFEKRWKISLLWLLASGLSIFLYFKGFNTQANQDGFAFFFAHPLKTLFGFFAFVGGFADLIPSRFEPYRFGLPIVAGLVFMLFWGFWFGRILIQYFKNFKAKAVPSSQVSFLVGAFTYLLLNALIVALLRPRFGFGVLVVSNYKLYPTLFLCLCYLTFLASFRLKDSLKFQITIITITLIFNGLSYWRFTPEVMSRRKNLMVSSYNQAHNQVGLGAMLGSPLQPYIAKIMEGLIQKNLYQYPTYFEIPKTNLEKYPNLEVRETTDNFTVSCPNYQNEGSQKDDGIYYALVSPKHTYLFASMPIPYNGKNPFRIGEGVVAFVQKSMLFAGVYKIGILQKFNGKTTFTMTAEQLERL